LVMVCPFPLMGIVGMSQDIDWDPNTGTLWVVTNAGMLSNHLIGGAIGPGGSGFVAPSVWLPSMNLTGLGIDTGGYDMIGHPYFYVTDGSFVAHIDRFALPAPPTFYFPNATENVSPGYGAPPLSGLAFSLRPVTYGTGGDIDATIPAISATGQSCTPNLTFAINVEDATPGAAAYLAVGFSHQCPPAPINPVCDLHVVMPFGLFIGPLVVSTVGTATVTLPIPPLLWPHPAIGLELYAQWLIVKTTGGIEVSEGMEFTIGLL